MSTDLQYTLVDNHYFVKNYVNEITNPFVTTQEQFDSYIGVAAYMGSTPYMFNFDTESVIIITTPGDSNRTPSFKIDSVKVETNTITVNYTQTQTKDAQTFEIRPLLLLAIDKSYSGFTVVTNPTIVEQ